MPLDSPHSKRVAADYEEAIDAPYVKHLSTSFLGCKLISMLQFLSGVNALLDLLYALDIYPTKIWEGTFSTSTKSPAQEFFDEHKKNSNRDKFKYSVCWILSRALRFGSIGFGYYSVNKWTRDYEANTAK